MRCRGQFTKLCSGSLPLHIHTSIITDIQGCCQQIIYVQTKIACSYYGRCRCFGNSPETVSHICMKAACESDEVSVFLKGIFYLAVCFSSGVLLKPHPLTPSRREGEKGAFWLYTVFCRVSVEGIFYLAVCFQSDALLNPHLLTPSPEGRRNKTGVCDPLTT